MITHALRRIPLAALAAGQLLFFAPASSAQSSSPPPIPGATGSVVPDGKGDGATSAIGAATGKVIEGTKKVLHPGGKDEGQKESDPLALLALGTKVVVREGDAARALQQSARGEGKTTEGTVIELDRRARVIVLRLADKTTERLRLDESRAADKDQDGRTSQDAGNKVSLSYTDSNGSKTTHTFTKVP